MPSETPPGAVLPKRIGPYAISRELGSGSMGVVYAARADGATTTVALKIMRPGRVGTRTPERFQREREVLRRLRHPGIAAFVDAGETRLDGPGTVISVPYLAMEFVEGTPLQLYAVQSGLTIAQRIELIARVCDAVHFAHEVGIVHRDLKPSNLLVTGEAGDPVGRPKVLDFGVAQARGTGLETIDTTLGTLVGTVPYMSPEQVNAGADFVDRRSDIYSLGVLAFELLGGRLPYEVKGRPLPVAARTIRSEEPMRLGRISRDLDGDAQYVVAKALQKSPAGRYATAAEFARDLRAAAAGRTVIAQAPGISERVRVFARRHPVGSAALAIGSGTLLGVALLWQTASVARDQAQFQAEAASEEERVARDRERELDRERGRLLRLSDLEELTTLELRAAQSWRLHPESVADLDDWLARAEALEARQAEHARTLDDLLAEDERGGMPLTYERRWWRASQEELVNGLSAFVAKGSGTLAEVRARRERCATLWLRTIEDEQAAWGEAQARIASSPIYDGLELEPQLGLVPLGPDPGSGLWEFWHVESGERPRRDAESGRWNIKEGTGVVLVLVPAGQFRKGAQSQYPSEPNYDAKASDVEAPVRLIRLSPYFLSKYELTMAQWERVAPLPSTYLDQGAGCGGWREDGTTPIGRISWSDGRRELQRLDLDHPSEAQWEYASRAGTQTIWSHGDDPAGLQRYANLGDLSYTELEHAQDLPTVAWRDPFACDAPVGSFEPNPWGFHDLQGNLWEFTLDLFGSLPEGEELLVDPVQLTVLDGIRHRSIKGGAYILSDHFARSSARMFFHEVEYENASTGLRPARSVRSLASERGE